MRMTDCACTQVRTLEHENPLWCRLLALVRPSAGCWPRSVAADVPVALQEAIRALSMDSHLLLTLFRSFDLGREDGALRMPRP
jgi:hypothetical protein